MRNAQTECLNWWKQCPWRTRIVYEIAAYHMKKESSGVFISDQNTSKVHCKTNYHLPTFRPTRLLILPYLTCFTFQVCLRKPKFARWRLSGICQVLSHRWRNCPLNLWSIPSLIWHVCLQNALTLHSYTVKSPNIVRFSFFSNSRLSSTVRNQYSGQIGLWSKPIFWSVSFKSSNPPVDNVIFRKHILSALECEKYGLFCCSLWVKCNFYVRKMET